jgi:tetratricopeptide (TPR) repeat protein
MKPNIKEASGRPSLTPATIHPSAMVANVPGDLSARYESTCIEKPNVDRQARARKYKELGHRLKKSHDLEGSKLAFLAAIDEYAKLEGRESLAVYRFLSEVASIERLQKNLDQSIAGYKVVSVGIEKLQGTSPLAMQQRVHLADVLAERGDWEEAVCLYRKAADTCGKVGLMKLRLSCQCSIARIYQQQGRDQEAINLLHGALAWHFQQNEIQNSEVIGITDALRKSYIRLGSGSHWHSLVLVINRLLMTHYRWDLDDMSEGLLDFMKMANFYSLLDEFDTAEAIFQLGIRRLTKQLSSFQVGLDELALSFKDPKIDAKFRIMARIYFWYTTHRRRTQDDFTRAAYLSLALEYLEKCNRPDEDLVKSLAGEVSLFKESRSESDPMVQKISKLHSDLVSRVEQEKWILGPFFFGTQPIKTIQHNQGEQDDAGASTVASWLSSSATNHKYGLTYSVGSGMTGLSLSRLFPS